MDRFDVAAAAVMMAVAGVAGVVGCSGGCAPIAEVDAPARELVGEAAVPARPLKKELATFTAEYEKKASPAVRAKYDAAIAEVGASGVMERAKKVGDLAPDFELIDATGSAVKLSMLLSRGPVVLTWYRGVWCPFCNMQLAAMQQRMGDFEAAGATMVAISPQMPEYSAETAKKDGLTMVVLSDISNRTADAYGIGYVLPESIAAKGKGGGKGGGPGWLAKFNGDDENKLPLSATYVVGRDGVIVYAYLNADYKVRAEPEEVLEVVRRVGR